MCFCLESQWQVKSGHVCANEYAFLVTELLLSAVMGHRRHGQEVGPMPYVPAGYLLFCEVALVSDGGLSHGAAMIVSFLFVAG